MQDPGWEEEMTAWEKRLELHNHAEVAGTSTSATGSPREE
jgi:hypothetical protein